VKSKLSNPGSALLKFSFYLGRIKISGVEGELGAFENIWLDTFRDVVLSEAAGTSYICGF
jgi:hypothetical protein